MEHYTTLQNLNPHVITMGILECLGFFAVVSAVVVKLFKSF